jgi:hypothetical protein
MSCISWVPSLGGSGFLVRAGGDSVSAVTAQIGDDGLDLFGDPRPELLAGVARARPEPSRRPPP